MIHIKNSVLKRPWQERCSVEQQNIALAMTQRFGLPDTIARILAGRGVHADQAEAFLEPRLRDLMPDPSCFQDMDKAVERIAKAITSGQKVAIFGDYDVDGACSAALLALYLKACGIETFIHIPDRISEGYGPNCEAIQALHEKGARLLVTVDCGTSSHIPFQTAASLDLDVVVLDHHQAPVSLPKAHAIVNPNRQDDLSGFSYLCAGGVVFLTLVALSRYLREKNFFKTFSPPDLMSYLDLVALATVADVVPLTGLNRAFVRQGLSVMKTRSRPGLAALFDVSGLNKAPEAWHLGFMIGPRINAGGRIGNAALGAQLLQLDDRQKALQLAEELDRLNRERQAIEQVAVDEAAAQADLWLLENPQACVLAFGSIEWHQGIVGLIAARLKERFQRPSFAFHISDGLATGSGRSIAGVDLGKAVRKAVEMGLAIKGGGHAMAAGMTIDAEKITLFRDFLESEIGQDVDDVKAGEALLIDAPLMAKAATPDFVTGLAKAGPFGSGHADPVFAFLRHQLLDAREVGNGHIRIRLKAMDGTQLEGVAFRSAEQDLGRFLIKNQGERIHVAGTLSLNHWNGREKVELRVQDAAFS